jgi:hypothetical protein
MDAASSVILPPVGFFCKAKPLLLQIGGPSLIGVAHSAPGRSKGKGKRSMRGRELCLFAEMNEAAADGCAHHDPTY